MEILSGDKIVLGNDTRLCGGYQRRILLLPFQNGLLMHSRKAHEGISVKEGKGAGKGDPDAL